MNKMTRKEAKRILDYYSKYLKGIDGYDNPSENVFIACAIDNLLDSVNNFSMDTAEPYELKINNTDYKIEFKNIENELKIDKGNDSSDIRFVNDIGLKLNYLYK